MQGGGGSRGHEVCGYRGELLPHQVAEHTRIHLCKGQQRDEGVTRIIEDGKRCYRSGVEVWRVRACKCEKEVHTVPRTCVAIIFES